MTLPFDDLFGAGATEKLVASATIGDEIPSVTQTLQTETSVLITLVWPSGTAQNVTFDNSTKEAAWGIGLCDAHEQGFLEKFAAQVFNPIGIELGIKTVSVCAPKPYEAPFLAMGLHRDLDDPRKLVAEIAPNSPLGQWAEEINGAS